MFYLRPLSQVITHLDYVIYALPMSGIISGSYRCANIVEVIGKEWLVFIRFVSAKSLCEYT